MREPGWNGLHESDPAELERRIKKETMGDAWVVAGAADMQTTGKMKMELFPSFPSCP
jgi:hypothetical protein